MTSRMPALGPRGEGWLLGQVILLGIIVVAGVRELAAGGTATPWGLAASVAGVLAMVVGGVLAIRGVVDLRDALSPFPRPVAGATLVETGVYRHLRHPIYSGLLLGSLGWTLVSGSAVSLAATGLLLALLAGKAHREEAWLVATHPGYRAYQARTKRFIPWVV